jgi:thiamine biosynthesis lipoprotein
VGVSPLLLEAIEVALRAARATGGRVDPTVGTAMRVVGYDRPFRDVAPHGDPITVSIGPVPGWRLIEVDRLRRTVRIPAGVELDLGATAKALCADRASEAIWRATGVGVLVGLGGDIAVAGPAPDGGWSVLVADDHAAPPDGPGEAVAISSGGVATSGTAVRRWTRGGRALHHLIDPSTGLPVDSTWRTVSVAAATCVDANIASTAAVILGDEAPSWLAARSLPARLVRTDGTVVTVAGWPAPEA